jgi:hypothetical protein
MDNHDSRHSVRVLKYLVENHVILLALPPYSTSFLQPLDVSVYGALKTETHALVDKWAASPGNARVSRRNIARIIFPAFAKRCSHDNIISGFAATGIWVPGKGVSRDAVADRHLGPAFHATSLRGEDKDRAVMLSELVDAVGADAAASSFAGSDGAATMVFESKAGKLLRLLVPFSLSRACFPVQRARSLASGKVSAQARRPRL